MNLLSRHSTCLMFLLAQLSWPPLTHATDESLQKTLDAANAVLRESNSVRAGANAGRVFDAAHALLEDGNRHLAARYFERGLQLSPWRLEEQLAYAQVLIALGRSEEALPIVGMVDERSESDTLCNQARKLAGKDPVPTPPAPGKKPPAGPWICLVRLGSVNEVVLADSMRKLRETLGVPVLLHGDIAELGKPHRSALTQWVKHYVQPQVVWDSAPGRQFLRTLGVSSPDDIRPAQLIKAMCDGLRGGGRDEEADKLQTTADFYREHDKQWDASVFADYGYRAAAEALHLEQAVVIGITEGDLYSEDSNYLFGMALTGARKGVVSYARYRADFNGEPPDRARLVTRMHKQLLCTTGFALNVPRPTDPTSARAYPASLAEHDAKSEYMSEACIAGFEKGLGVKLPEAAHKPAGRR